MSEKEKINEKKQQKKFHKNDWKRNKLDDNKTEGKNKEK